MAFLDENGLTKLWSLIREKDAKIELLTYVGTGTKGMSNPTSITFSFPPKFVVKAWDIDSSGNVPSSSLMSIPVAEITTEYKNNMWLGNYGKCSEDRLTYYWYTTSGYAANQHNTSGTTYAFFAIG